MTYEQIFPKEIRTEYFHIEIRYNILSSGRMRATLKVIKNPIGVTDVIYDGGSMCLDSSYKSFITKDGMDVENLHRKLKDIISITTKNIKTLEFNNLLSEVLS